MALFFENTGWSGVWGLDASLGYVDMKLFTNIDRNILFPKSLKRNMSPRIDWGRFFGGNERLQFLAEDFQSFW